MDKEVKNIQRHDMTLTFKNIDLANKALETIRNFCLHASSTKLLIKQNTSYWNQRNVSLLNQTEVGVTNGAIKCLAIHTGHDELECFKK